MNELLLTSINKKNFLEYYLNFKWNKNKDLQESKKLNDIFESHENLSEKKVIWLKLHYLANSIWKSYLSWFEYISDYITSIDLLTFEDWIYKDLSWNEVEKETYNLIVKDIKVDNSKTKIFIFDDDILYINLLK